MRFLFAPTLLPFLLVGAAIAIPRNGDTTPKTTVLERDVVIVGGGSSGTYAAIRLKDEGLKVVVVEKEDVLGGHADTYIDPDTGIPINMGVVVFHDLAIVREYFGRMNVSLAPVKGGNTSTQYYDFATGRAVPAFQPASESQFGQALQKYGTVLEKYPYLSVSLEDLPYPVPEELLVSFSEFIETNGLEDVVQLINSLSQCNGELWKRPAIYGVKGLGLALLQAVQKGFINAESGDNNDLYRAAQKHLGDDVVYNAVIESIDRSGHGISVRVNTPGGKVIVKAKKLLVAIQPTKENLKGIGLKLTPEEANIFGKFESFFYGSAVFTHEGLDPDKSYNNIGTNTPFNLLTLPGAYSYHTFTGTNKVQTYFGSEDPTITKEKVTSLIKDELHRLEAEGNIEPGKAEFVFFSSHSPFHLHVDVDDIRKGFYKDLFALQAKTDTFWTGATFVEHDSSMIWTWTEKSLLPKVLRSFKDK